jgi:hypothetical protein
MYELMTNYPIYVVLGVVLIIWTVISSFLFQIDSKLTRIEKSLNLNKSNSGDDK